jgi:hypothetical protein
MGDWMYRSTFSWPRTNWRWVVSFTLLPLYPPGNNPRYPLDRRLGRPQSRSRRRGEEKILDSTGTSNSDPLVAQPIVSRYTDCAIPVFLHFGVSSENRIAECTLQCRIFAHSAWSVRMQGNSSFTSCERINKIVVLCVSVVRVLVLSMSLSHSSFYDTDPVEGLLCRLQLLIWHYIKKGKAFPVTGCRGP